MKDNEIEALDFSNWPLPDDYLVEVGRVAILWTFLESLVNLVLAKLSGFDDLNDPKHFILFAHTNVPQKLDMLGALCEQLCPSFPTLRPYKAVLAKLRTAQKARNTYVHNGLVYEEETGKCAMPHGSARGALKTRIDTVKIADIRRATVQIEEAHRALYELVFRRKLLPVWERKAEPSASHGPGTAGAAPGQ